MLYDWISKVGFFLRSSYHNKTLHLPGLHCDHVLPFFSYFHLHEVHNSLNDQVNETYPPHPWKTPCESNMVTSGRRHVVQLSWMLSVPPWREILRCWTLWPLTPFHSALSACWSARHVEHCELKKKNYVSFPLSGVVLNIRPSLVLLASSEGVRLDPPCAKKKTRKERKRF